MSYYVSDPIRNLIGSLAPKKEKVLEGDSVVQVDLFASKVAHFYEKMRNVVDYKDEHLLRRSAIERMLKRRIVVDKDKGMVAENVVRELIRAKYIENNKLPESKVELAQAVVNKYLYLIDSQHFRKRRDKSKFFDWIIGIAACEVEDVLVSLDPVESIVEAMFKIMDARVVFKDDKMDKPTQKILTYIAIHRTLTKSDPATIRYYLLKLAYPEWFSNSANDIKAVAANMQTIKNEIDGYMKHPLSFRFRRFMRRYTPLFLIMRDVLADNLDDIDNLLQDPATLQGEIEKKTIEKYKDAKKKLRRAALRSIIYIFLTKMILAIILEVPVDMYLVDEIDWLPIAINIVFPPFIMLLIAVFTRSPNKRNTQNIIAGISSIIYEDKRDSVVYKVRSSYVKSKFLGFIFKVIYAITFVTSFGLMGYVLYQLNFNFASMTIFFVFLALVAFFGYRVRQGVKEYTIPSKKDSVLRLIFDLYTLPILRAGRFMSQEFSKINIFIFIFDFLFEAPFKMLVEMVEQWLGFVREKREEII